MNPGTCDTQKLVEMVQRIMDADGTEREIDDLITLVTQLTGHPEIVNLIFHSKGPTTAAEIVDTALAYRPIQLGHSP